MTSCDELVAIMARLRGPEGCPWDRAQSHATLRRYLVDFDLLSRTPDGTYWRSGGTVPVSP